MHVCNTIGKSWTVHVYSHSALHYCMHTRMGGGERGGGGLGYLVVLFGTGSNAASYIFAVCGSDHQFISCMAYHSLVSFLCGICACKVLKLR